MDGGGFVARHVEDVGGGADECDAFAFTGAGEFGVLGEEPIAGIDGFGPGVFGDGDDFVDVEVGLDRVAFFPDFVGFISLDAVGGVSILPGIDRDCAGLEFVCCAERADGDFAAVGDENLGELT